MRVGSKVKKLCEHCYIVRKKNRKIYNYCKVHPRHKQRQGFSIYFNFNKYNLNPYINAYYQSHLNLDLEKNLDLEQNLD